MKSVMLGTDTSPVEVTNISVHGFWLLINARELFVAFKHFPWFRDASVGQICNVEFPSVNHLRWPELDVDLAVESIENPRRYPLVSQVPLSASSQPPVGLPELLRPTGVELIKISARRMVKVPKATPQFRLWTGPPVKDTYGSKEILDFRGRPAFAELAILWSMADVGWEGVWIDTFAKAYRTDYWRSKPIKKLPAHVAGTLAPIMERVGVWGGGWDVLCWKDRDVLFLEAKRQRSRDNLRPRQIRWLATALDVGFEVRDFLVVAWSAGS